MRSIRSALPLLPLLIGLLAFGCDAPTAPPEDTFEISAPAFNNVKGGPGTAKANLHSYNQTGVTAKITFVDDGGTLTITGTATGLIPGVLYGSLIYDIRSVPGGPVACEPAIFDATDPGYLIPTMFVGLWVNNGDGTGTLAATNTNGGADYVPLSMFRTISVRNFFIAPVANADLAACGEVATHGAR